MIHNVLHEQARVGGLFPGGAIFFTRSQPLGSVREWRNGASSVLATDASEGSLKVKQPYAIWSSSGGLIRRELTTGTNLTVIGGPTGGDVAATGDVAWGSSSPYEIFLFQGGMNIQLTNDGGGEFGNTSPVTDGIHVVYERRALFPAPTNSSIRLSDPGSEITLASNITRDLEPGEGYQVNDAWIPFVRLDAASSRQVWRRSPAGVETQVSAFGSSSRIESMGPAGEIVFTSEATGTPRRYRALVAGSPTDIGSTLGRPMYIDGQLNVMMGATLLQVD